MRMFANLIIYQTVWLVCVLFGNAGALYAWPLLVLHLLLSDKKEADLKMMGLLLTVGLVIDGSLQTFDFFSFSNSGWPIPGWLMLIWLALATLPHHSLAWLQGRPLLSAAFGAIGGPLAYWSGVKLGIAIFHWPLIPALVTLAVIWALLWPAVMHCAAKFTDATPDCQANARHRSDPPPICTVKR